jgi:C_GCAxxG_C_C family probable redox protein
MKSRIDVAGETFSKGYNCAQAVFSAYAPVMQVRQDDALKISTGFGGGMGRLQEVCGAVTGATMVIGCANGVLDSSDTASKQKAYALVQELAARFREIHGSILCRELLGCNLNTPEGRKEMSDRSLTKTVCLPCVRDACTILEETMFGGDTAAE